MNLTLSRPIIFFDLETTGINIANDNIIEISMLKLFPDQHQESKTYRINPQRPIPKEASAVHGIYDEDVKECPVFKDLANDILSFLDNGDIAGYNSNRFDIPMLVEEFLRVDLIFSLNNRRFVDVQKIFHTMEKRTLEAAYRFYCQKELTNAHQAEADVKATYEVLLAQLDKYPDLKNDINFLHEFTKEEDFVDLGRRMIYNNDRKVVFNFGKHKGKEVTKVLQTEPQYYDWIMQNDFMLHTKHKLKEIKLKMNHK